MNQKHDSLARTIFKLAGAAAIVALILSISRLFLSTSERETTEFCTYNLANSAEMTAFLSIIVVSILFVIIGALVIKEYDIIGTPMIIAGVLSLIYVTIASYMIQSFSHEYGPSAATGELVLTIVIAAEWLMLVIYTWKMDPVASGTPVNEPTKNDLIPPAPPASTPTPPAPPATPDDDLKI